MNVRNTTRARLTACLLVLLGLFVAEAPQTSALPIEPDIKKLAEEAQQPPPLFIPSRVGWNGPEAGSQSAQRSRWEAAIAPVLAAEQERRFRNTLREVFIPAPEAIVGITAIIFLLRRLRNLRERQQRQAVLAQQPQAA